jgi:hypothetical protein
MSLDNFATSIKLRLLSAQPRDIVDIYQDINVSDLKIGENRIPITNPQVIRILKNSTRVFNVSITSTYAGVWSISKTGEDYATTHQYLLGYDTDSSDAYSESELHTDMDTDGSSESGASADAYSESDLHTDMDTDGSSESGASADAYSESDLHTDMDTDGSSESGASADAY